MNVPTPEREEPMTVSSRMTIPIYIYSTVLSSSQVPSIPTPTRTTIRNFNAIFPNKAIFLYAFEQCPNPSSTAQESALVQSTTSAYPPMSNPIVVHTPPFNIHLDPADMDFTKLKLDECKQRQKNTLLSEGQRVAYV